MSDAPHLSADELLEYGYGELDSKRQAFAQAHLLGCADCSGAFAKLRGVRRAFASLEFPPAPREGMESLLAYAQKHADRARNVAPPRRWRWLSLVSTFATFLCLGVLALRVLPELDPDVMPKRVVPAAPAPAESEQDSVREKAPASVGSGVSTDVQAPVPAAAPTSVPPPASRSLSKAKKAEFTVSQEAESKGDAVRSMARPAEPARERRAFARDEAASMSAADAPHQELKQTASPKAAFGAAPARASRSAQPAPMVTANEETSAAQQLWETCSVPVPHAVPDDLERQASAATETLTVASERACRELIEKYPGSPFAESARQRLRRLKAQ
ncbi:MAG: hypothetical protein ACKVPX_15925 [Myxococcaceae bacterium]